MNIITNEWKKDSINIVEFSTKDAKKSNYKRIQTNLSSGERIIIWKEYSSELKVEDKYLCELLEVEFQKASRLLKIQSLDDI